MMKEKPLLYAHSKKSAGKSQWQTLRDHSELVAQMAGAFADSFASAAWARLLGYLHDAGKARLSFQNYLDHANGLNDSAYDAREHSHSGAGAEWLMHSWSPAGGSPKSIGRLLAYCVAGHHAGLPDWASGVTPNGSLFQRMEDEKTVLEESSVSDWLETYAPQLNGTALTLPWRFFDCDLSFWVRMLYSSLVDADFLDTESFMDENRANTRAHYSTLQDLAECFFAKLDQKQHQSKATEVNSIRAEIRTACESAAEHKPGLFSLTVPTGGGKTLSGTAFAFRHALKFQKTRIIYVIPYTSIIEQTADVLREFVGADNVLEHHSNFDPDKETQQSRLASENWDAPIIVTTNVQFFESLYACKSSRCRKLHNIVNSVVILDEAQLLPPRLLHPCIEVIRQLTEHYGVSFVLSTATQPALPDLKNLCEIIPPEMNLYQKLKRTEIQLPANRSVRKTWEEIADSLSKIPKVLCVVNTKRDCRMLWDLMPKGTIHLSANMCGEHRTQVISKVKKMLSDNMPVRVVSTQLVEAGVDFDFPVVYRAFSGLPSIAQAAGRCNREGVKKVGNVVVFMPPKQSPQGELRKAEDTMLEMMGDNPTFDANQPDNYPRFFERFYKRQNDWGHAFDSWLVKDARSFQFQFREAAAAFRMIDDTQVVPIIVRYTNADEWIDALRKLGPRRDTMRRLQRYVVNVPRHVLSTLIEKGFVEQIHDGIYVQTMKDLYSEAFGFDWSRVNLSAEDLIV